MASEFSAGYNNTADDNGSTSTKKARLPRKSIFTGNKNSIGTNVPRSKKDAKNSSNYRSGGDIQEKIKHSSIKLKNSGNFKNIEPEEVEHEISSLRNQDKLMQTLGDNRVNVMRTIRQLHQLIFRLERQLQEKESEYTRIVTDLKYTRVDELKIQLETMKNEYHRVQSENQRLDSELSKLRTRNEARTRRSNEDAGRRELTQRISTMGKVIKGLDDERQELIAKNHFLMTRLEQVLRNDDFPKEDIEQEMKTLNQSIHRGEMSAPSSPEPRNESNLVATMVESKVSEGLQYRYGTAVHAVRVEQPIAEELGSVRNEVNSLKLAQMKLTSERDYYKGQLDLTKQQMHLQEELNDSPRSFKSSSRHGSPRRTTERVKTKEPDSLVLTEEENSAIRIQRAWRNHRDHCVSLRKNEKTSRMKKHTEKHANDEAVELIRSAIQGHLSREQSLSRASEGRKTPSIGDTIDGSEAGTFVTEEDLGSIATEGERINSLLDMKAAMHGQLERQKSIDSIRNKLEDASL